jgi:hypothetical protein
MQCRVNSLLSPEWIDEKLRCINRSAMRRTVQIRQMFKEKVEVPDSVLTSEEFGKILIFKGLARVKEKFLRRYTNSDEVENKTRVIFESGLNNYRFEDIIERETLRNEVLQRTSFVLNTLSQLDYVGKSVASAALTLAFPHLFGTVDYIVPGILHCKEDDNQKENPFRKNLPDLDRFERCLLLPSANGMTPKQARDLAKENYPEYIQELWNIKREFGLNHKVAEIEMALWSYGICYLKKQNKKDSVPFRFQTEPSPPQGGLFSKNC